MKVVIVGAGVAGLTIGWRLLQAGADVLVLERAQPAQGATWAAAGMLSASGESADMSPAERALSEFSAAAWPDFAREIEETTGRAVDYLRPGKLVAFFTKEEQALASCGLVSRSVLLSTADARRMEPMLSAEIIGALLDPSEAQVDNRALGMALRDAFVGAGGRLSPNESVVRIEIAEGRAVGTLTPFTVHAADAFILAAGAWTGRIEGLPADAVPPVFPVKGEIVCLGGGAVPERIVWGNGVYLVPRRDRLLVGATTVQAGFDTRITEAARDGLTAGARALLPSLASWKVVEHWAGLRPGTPDGLPILGQTLIERLYVASGQFRNGILFAPAVGDILASLVLGRKPAIAAEKFDPRRFSGAQLAHLSAVR